MSPINKILKTTLICVLTMAASLNTVKAQNWMFGVSAAGNLNYMSGTTQRLDNAYFVPTAFHKGTAIKPFGSLLLEYNPGKTFGGILNVGYDGRGVKFDDVIAPCNCPATLKTNLSYITVEPSLRINAGKTDFFFFLGPRVAFNLDKDYQYTQLKQDDRAGEFSAINTTIFSGQVGAGYDYLISSPASKTAVMLAPFISYHPYFGQDPRTIESMSLTTVRAGVALKFGKARKSDLVEVNPVVVPIRQVGFSVRPPKMGATEQEVSETFPLLNYVFFDKESNAIPSRYIVLSKVDAGNFRESQLQTAQTLSTSGRSSRQLNVYYNILNIIGDRLRTNPNSTIDLSGASDNGPEEGKLFAQEIKEYLVSTFDINEARITTQGRIKPLVPSEQPGGTQELVLLKQGDRRVDITSTSPELSSEVGGDLMRPINIQSKIQDPMDSQLIFNVDGASDLLKSYTVDVSDGSGNVKTYGPYYSDKAGVSGQTILGTNKQGNYLVTMNGITKSGELVKKEAKVQLVSQNDVIKKGYRYSILFDFDKTKTIASYEKFLDEVVSPLITDGSRVIIHGHTDIIGSEEYNHTLSHDRAMEAQKILEKSLKNSGKRNVTFKTEGFGEILNQAPFENALPEERFYNRTVIIDITSSN
jgi:outer membrane protein OmpA-like peptidoglycan-associated protein